MRNQQNDLVGSGVVPQRGPEIACIVIWHKIQFHLSDQSLQFLTKMCAAPQHYKLCWMLVSNAGRFLDGAFKDCSGLSAEEEAGKDVSRTGGFWIDCQV